jgi:hypothetical protein
MTTFRDGYGKHTYGNLLYGIDAADVVGVTTASVSSTATVSYVVVKSSSASVSISATVAAEGGYDATGSASATITSSVDLYWNRVMSFEASDQISAEGTEVSARYKWLDATDPTTTWTTADYLERAA